MAMSYCENNSNNSNNNNNNNFRRNIGLLYHTCCFTNHSSRDTCCTVTAELAVSADCNIAQWLTDCYQSLRRYAVPHGKKKNNGFRLAGNPFRK